MSTSANEGWNLVDDDAKVLWREYEFTKGAYATTLAFRGADGLVVVSPATNMPDRAFDALAEHGEVRGLVANNAFHHLGQASWRARFPNAESYAPSEGLGALEKKKTGIPYRRLADLGLPSHVEYACLPGFKTGEAFFSIKTRKGTVWFTGDLLTNVHRTPGPPIKWLFTWTGSAPGFRLFKPGVWFFVKDKKALKAWMLDRVAKDPPSIAVPAHGAAFEAPDLAALAKVQIERM